MSEELKPCPFCGTSDSFVERADFSSAYVFCNHCSAKGPTECQESDEEEIPGADAAARAWNKRASQQPSKENSKLSPSDFGLGLSPQERDVAIAEGRWKP